MKPDIHSNDSHEYIKLCSDWLQKGVREHRRLGSPATQSSHTYMAILFDVCTPIES